MAVGIHIAYIKKDFNAANGIHPTVGEDAQIESSSGSPTVPDYIAAEAAAGYLVNQMTDNMIITVSVADINNAS